MTILKFGAKWCGPCSSLGQTILSLEESDQAKITSYDIDSSEPSVVELVKKYAIRSIPTMVKLDESGSEVSRVNGAQSKEKLLAFIG
jgi:thioredoxin-like negative regulator of GroEL